MKVTSARFPIYQAGAGVSHVFHGSPYQKGHGLGSVLGGLFRAALPWLKSGARVVGRQALSTGGDILRDVVGGRSLSEATRTNLVKAGQNLAAKASSKLSKMQNGGGGAYKQRGVKRKRQSTSGRPSKRLRRSRVKKTKVVKRKNKTTRSRFNKKAVVDIFG